MYIYINGFKFKYCRFNYYYHHEINNTLYIIFFIVPLNYLQFHYVQNSSDDNYSFHDFLSVQ